MKSIAEYEKEASDLGMAHRALPWAIGDLINVAFSVHGEKAAQMLEGFALPENLLRDYSYVADRFRDRKVRALGRKLTFYHFREVASLPSEQAAGLLKMAHDLGWSTKQLRREKADVTNRARNKNRTE